MLLKRLFLASAVAVAAFASSANQKQAHAEMAYTDSGPGCYILGSPSNDFFCNEYVIDDGFNTFGGSTGSGDPGADTKICGVFPSRPVCGGSETTVVEKYVCNTWQVTGVDGSVSFLGKLPTGLGVGVTAVCSAYTKTTTTTVTPFRWDS